MLYLVHGTLNIHHYMDDHGTRKQVVRIVEADSALLAEEKFNNHYIAKSAEYDVTYNAYVDSVTETIF